MGKQYDLFKTENEILQEALKDLKNNSYKDHPLQQKYQVLAQNYGKLLRQTIKMLKISDSQQRHLQRVQKDMRNLLDNAGQGFLTFGEELTVHKEYSSECLRIFGQKIENRNIIELLFSGCNADAKNEIIQALHSLWNSEFIQKEILQQLPALIDLNGRTYQLEYRPVTIINDSRGTNFIMLVITDVTESQKAFAQIDYLSSHDKLTGLYNRAHIDNAIVKLNNKDNLPMAMIMADVNGLKLTNDVFGHLEGDRLLQGIANVLRKSLRENDLIARWGGDEFLVVLTQADEEVVK
jgi:hypothetical protein